jgi:hypothetical protein
MIIASRQYGLSEEIIAQVASHRRFSLDVVTSALLHKRARLLVCRSRSSACHARSFRVRLEAVASQPCVRFESTHRSRCRADDSVRSLRLSLGRPTERSCHTELQCAETVVQSSAIVVLHDLATSTQSLLGLARFRAMFQDAWFWRLKPQRKQPWTTAAILLVIMAKKVVWNNYCKLTHKQQHQLWPNQLKLIKQSLCDIGTIRRQRRSLGARSSR